ncbi:acyltransferase [Arthrobacter sp. MMS24-S77]
MTDKATSSLGMDSVSLPRILRAISFVVKKAASLQRIALLRAKYPGLVIRRSFVGPRCDISVGLGASLVIDGCHISHGVTITAGIGSSLMIDADFVGPYSSIVARQSIKIGSGSKVAERVSIRDGNHDHSVELRQMKFTASPIAIGPDVWIGANSVVLAGVQIGTGATVAAGAVVTKSIPTGETFGGVPARKISGVGKVQGGLL